ncbi:MAG: hypothetical protein LBG65_07870 [Puniceicoccales bacterium]|nr:hypothetical protein [Puniceicoccales bacterium]
MYTDLPSSPKLEDDSGRFSFWCSLGKLKLSPKLELNIPVGFSPIPHRQNSRLLGLGWAFPLLESTFFAVGDYEYKLRFPTGHHMSLWVTKDPGQFVGGSWRAVVSGKNATLQSSCGTTLSFETGRLKKLETEDGVLVEFHDDSKGKYWITANGEHVFSYQNKIDATTNQRVAILTFQDGRQARLRFAKRPFSIKARAGTPPALVDSLVSFQRDGEVETAFNFKLDGLEIVGLDDKGRNPDEKRVFSWDVENGFMTRDARREYSQFYVEGIRCVATKELYNGEETVHGESEDKSKKVTRAPRLKETYLSEFLTGPDLLKGKLKRRYRLTDSGPRELVEQCVYDRKGELKEHLIDGKWITYSPLVDEARDARTGAQAWRKTRDESGRIKEFISNGTRFLFKYSGEKADISIYSPDGALIDKTELPSTQILKLFQ